MLPATTPNQALTGTTTPMHFIKLFEGKEPGEMMPLALGNREENSTCEAKLNKILT
jgi:hypothetical protein